MKGYKSKSGLSVCRHPVFSILSAMMLLGGMMMFCLSGCTAPQYRVDYEGQMDCFTNAKASYRAGAKVKLCFAEEYIGTDTDYSFFLDGEPLSATYRRNKGFLLRFVMPAHDVTLTVRAVNSMVRGGDADDPEKHPVLTFRSFDGGGYAYTALLADESIVSLVSEHHYGDSRHEEVDGAAYDVIFTFTGLKAGATTLKIEARSPIIEPEDYYYDIVVDEALNVTVTESAQPTE